MDPRTPPASNPNPAEIPQVIDPSEAPSPANNPNPDETPPADPAPDEIAPPPAPGEAPLVV
ncbi:MAG: hypothetical protein ACOYLS_06810 [Polymorphobacter sp.]